MPASTVLMQADTVRSLAPLRLWLYLRANEGARISGIVALVREKDRKGCLLAEFFLLAARVAADL